MKYDYIITGAGCSGLSLAYYLTQSSLKHKKILLIDKDKKTENDRTWSFWERGDGTFEEVVHHQWSQLYYKSKEGEQLLDIAPFRYKMIRGIDFYTYILNHLAAFENIDIVFEEIISIKNNQDTAEVKTAKQTFEADYIFNSIIFEKLDFSKVNYVAQHFGGWVIECEEPHFHPDKATLMDFRIPQQGETRFMYVLPTDEKTALIEATAFSNKVMSKDEYGEMIQDYLENYLAIENYKILHVELGIIPMTTYNFKKHHQKNIVHIGTMGGQVKPSSGYAFIRIQKHTQAVVEALEKGHSPHLKTSWERRRFMIYDNILLNVMLKNRVETGTVFHHLFKKNHPSEVFQFLNEETSFFKELKIINAAPKLPFTIAAFDEFFKKLTSR